MKTKKNSEDRALQKTMIQALVLFEKERVDIELVNAIEKIYIDTQSSEIPVYKIREEFNKHRPKTDQLNSRQIGRHLNNMGLIHTKQLPGSNRYHGRVCRIVTFPVLKKLKEVYH